MNSPINPFIQRSFQKQEGSFTSNIEESSKENQPNPFLMRSMEKQKEPEESLLKSTVRELLQVPQGLAESTLPGIASGLWQMLAAGEVLDPEELEHLEMISKREGVPFDKKAYMEAAKNALGAVPTVSNIASKIEEYTGLPLEPKTARQKATRFISSLARRTPELPISAETKALSEASEQFSLPKYKGMTLEKEPMITPIVDAEKQAGMVKELDIASKKAIEDIIEQKIPIKKMQDMGIDLENAYTVAYDQANKTASKLGKENIPLDDLVNFIKKEIHQIKTSAPSLSKTDKIVLRELEKEYKQLTVKPSKKYEVSYPTMETKLTKPSPKEMTGTQSLDQYKNFNENVKGIYRKPEFTGAESEIKDLYAKMNEKLINGIEKVSPELAEELKFANKIFSGKAKLDQVNGIISKSFEKGYDANKLAKTLSKKRERAFLERSLGKDGVKDLEKIAKYGQQAEEKVFNHLKNPLTMKEYISKMTPLDLMLLVGYKSHIKLPFTLTKGALQRAQGYLFTRDLTRKNFVDFLQKASKTGENPYALFNAANNLNKSINEEFGSEDDLINMSLSKIED